MIIGWIIGFLYIVLILMLLLIAIVLFVPFHYRLSYAYKETQNFQLEASMGSIVGFHVSLQGPIGTPVASSVKIFRYTLEINGKDKKKTKNKGKADHKMIKKDKETIDSTFSNDKNMHEKKKFTFNKFRDYSNVLNKQLIENSIQFGADIINIIKPKIFRVDSKVGFYEPDQTAWLYTLSCVFKSMVKPKSITMIPVWDREHFEIDAMIAGRFQIISILVCTIRLLFSKTTRIAWKQWRMAKKKYSYS